MKKSLILLGLFVASTMLLVGTKEPDGDEQPETRADEVQALLEPTASPQEYDIVGDYFPADAAKTAEVDSIKVTWRRSPRSEFIYPNGSNAENYEYYRDMADSGNGLAAFKLSELMGQCQNAFLTEEALNTAIAEMKQSSAYVHPRVKERVYIAEQDQVDKYVRSARRKFQSCKNFTQQQREQDDEWLELAVSLGDTLAMLEYGRMLDDPVEFMMLANLAWLAGDSNGLIGLAESYDRQYRAGVDVSANVHAYVAMHAYVAITRPVFGSDADSALGSHTEYYEGRIVRLAESLSQDDLDAATSRAAELVRSNVNCCYHPLHLR